VSLEIPALVTESTEFRLAPDCDGALRLEPAENYSIPTYDPTGEPFTAVDEMYGRALSAIYETEVESEEGVFE
jgi:hypothetical protein